MDTPRGRVVEVVRSGTAILAEVEVDGASTCARCAAGKGCGAGLVSGGRTRRVQALVLDGVELKAGDEVRIELSGSNLLRASGLVYGLPLAGAVTLAGLAYWLQPGDVAAAIMAILGLAAGWLAARRRLANAACLRDFTPTITKRLAEAP
jgi:sigma-E factor negative regulatory protein RseC